MKYLVICFCSAFFGFVGFAQSVDGYSQDQMSGSSYMLRPTRGTVFKYDPLRLLCGEVVFSYERRFKLHSSVEIEAGATLSEVPRLLYAYDFVSPDPQDNPVSKFGYVGSIAYRYYVFNSGFFKKLYFSPKVKYLTFRYSDEHIDDKTVLGDHQFSGSQLLMNVGWQHWINYAFALDFYVGTGFGLYTMHRDYTLKSYFEPDEHYTYTTKERMTPLNAGIKVTVTVGRQRRGGGLSF